MAKKEDFIGVFDSGVGGISVLKELITLMPKERFLYFGDSANAPYGSRTTAEIQDLSLSAAEYLINRGVKALVVACNTVTAAAITLLRNRYPDTIIVGIEPALKPAVERFGGGKIGVMATPVTLREEKFANLFSRFEKAEVIPIPVVGLVELVEEGMADSQAAIDLLTPILAPYVGKLDAVVLGCTHYPFAANVISQILGQKTALFDGGAGTARETLRRLAERDLLSDGTGEIQMENSRGDIQILRLSMELLNTQ